MSLEDELRVWVGSRAPEKGRLSFRAVSLKDGPRAVRIATIGHYGDCETGEVKHRELTLRSHSRRADGWVDFAKPDDKVTLRDSEIEALLAFLSEEGMTAGRYRLIDALSPAANWNALLASSNVDAQALGAALSSRRDLLDVVKVIAHTPQGLSAAEAATLAHRRALVSQLKMMIASRSTTESDVQQLIGREYWLFGGRFVGVAGRRNLTTLDQYDIPLLSPDGTLHVVELKGPHAPNLVRRHRNHHIVGPAVHEAVCQAMNYLRSLDEQGTSLSTTFRDELGEELNLRRVMATVVIGSADQVAGVTPEQVRLALRTYNGHLSRVEVMTYDSLVDAAERTLDFEDSLLEARATSAEQPAPERWHS